jgi:hypothetical protein
MGWREGQRIGRGRASTDYVNPGYFDVEWGAAVGEDILELKCGE